MLKSKKVLIIPVFVIFGLIFVLSCKFSTSAGEKCVISTQAVNNINDCAKVGRARACEDENCGGEKVYCSNDKVTALTWQPENRCYALVN